MQRLTYFEARNKIIEAYFRDEIEPWECKFCFCGNLCNNTTEWVFQDNEELPYSYAEYIMPPCICA